MAIRWVEQALNNRTEAETSFDSLSTPEPLLLPPVLRLSIGSLDIVGNFVEKLLKIPFGSR